MKQYEYIQHLLQHIYRSYEHKKEECILNYKRHSSLGFFPINKYFKESEGHHISENFVIYIPRELHRSIPHNIWTGKNMDKINKLAIEYLNKLNYFLK